MGVAHCHKSIKNQLKRSFSCSLVKRNVNMLHLTANRQCIFKISVLVLFISLLAACGGGSTPDAPVETPSSSPAAAAPSSESSVYGGTYSGRAANTNNGSVYTGPLSITLTRDVTGNYTVTGSYEVTRGNSSGTQSITTDQISGTVTSGGALTATGNINLRSMTGTVDAATGKISGFYTYNGVAGEYTRDFSIAK
jgi:hypothetical protein